MKEARDGFDLRTCGDDGGCCCCCCSGVGKRLSAELELDDGEEGEEEEGEEEEEEEEEMERCGPGEERV